MNRIKCFYIVGAAKSGTTSLYHYLDKHPDVFMSPIKEPHYFCKDIRCKNFSQDYRKQVFFDTKKYLSKPVLEKKHIAYLENIEEYIQLFREREDESIVGEISTGYLYSRMAAEEIYSYNSDAKIVMVLRNPIERAFSHWMMNLRGRNICETSFLEAMRVDQDKNEKGWGNSHLYVELGLYYEQVKRYLDTFPKEHILVFLYEDLCADPSGFFKQLYDFLEVMPLPINSEKKYNSASMLKYPAISRVIYKLKLNEFATKCLSKNMKSKVKSALITNKKLPELTSSDRVSLQHYFDGDIGLLEKLIDRNLSTWRSSKKQAC